MPHETRQRKKKCQSGEWSELIIAGTARVLFPIADAMGTGSRRDRTGVTADIVTPRCTAAFASAMGGEAHSRGRTS